MQSGRYIFPATIAVNMFSITALMIILALGGNSAMAADMGLVHGATVALFYVFSANARNLILNPSSSVKVNSLLLQRLYLILPLAGFALYLSILADVWIVLASILIVRRSLEWLIELVISDAERRDDGNFAVNYIFIQSFLLLTLIISFMLMDYIPWWILLIWALSPLIPGKTLYDQLATREAKIWTGWSQMLPHFGSTAIIGITVYVFRLFLVLITGKETAGDLFAAFALGGFVGSIFANAIGPSIVLHETRTGDKSLPAIFKITLLLIVITGFAMVAITVISQGYLEVTGKSDFFWQATGLSMIGGVIMVYAQRIRLRLIQKNEDEDVFGPDVLVNILIIASIPFLVWLVGRETLISLYLISSILSLVFYYSASKQKSLWKKISPVWSSLIKTVFIIMLFFPIFIQYSDGIFNDPAYKYNSGGVLKQLPIPLSVIACYGGIIIFGFYRHARISLTFIFTMFVMMVFASINTTMGLHAEAQEKYIFLVQFILPMFALVLGQLYESASKDTLILEKTLLYVLAIIVPLQLIATYIRGNPVLSPYLLLFSIYQNLQYVCVIFIGCYLYILFTFWEKEKYRTMIILSFPLIGIYVGSSISLLSIGFLYSGMLIFAIYNIIKRLDIRPFVAFILVAAISTGYLYHFKNKFTFKFEKSPQEKQKVINYKSNLKLHNINERMYYWKYYIDQITSDTKSILFGTPKRPKRSEYPSAHNYYLDFIHSFGVIALVPMFILIGYTLLIIFKNYKKIYDTSSLLGLSITVLFLILVDNSFKVGMRQPYSGIVTFFLWGILLTRLSDIVKYKKINDGIIG